SDATSLGCGWRWYLWAAGWDPVSWPRRLVSAGGRTPHATRAQAAGRLVHTRGLSRCPVVGAVQQGRECGRRGAIAGGDDRQIRLLIEVHGPLNGGNDPRDVIAKRATAEERQEHAVVAMALCIHQCRTQRSLIGGLEHELGEGGPQP